MTKRKKLLIPASGPPPSKTKKPPPEPFDPGDGPFSTLGTLHRTDCRKVGPTKRVRSVTKSRRKRALEYSLDHQILGGVLAAQTSKYYAKAIEDAVWLSACMSAGSDPGCSMPEHPHQTTILVLFRIGSLSRNLLLVARAFVGGFRQAQRPQPPSDIQEK